MELMVFTFLYWSADRLIPTDSWRGLVAMSNNAIHITREFNKYHPLLETIMAKTRVIYPAFPDFSDYVRQYDLSTKPLHLMFIGRQFFRKGGHIAVAAFEELCKKKSFRMTVVSGMDEWNYMRSCNPGNSIDWRIRMQNAGVRHIDYSLPYPQIRRLISTADVMLLPTLDDSFGFSICEAMASGVVPVATAVRALPEFVHHAKNGLLIDVETDRYGRLDQNKTSDEQITQKLVDTINRLADQPEQMRALGQAARLTYLKLFTMDRLERELLQLYADALRS